MRTPVEAVRAAQAERAHPTHDLTAMCLHFVRADCYQAPYAGPDATACWYGSSIRHVGEQDPPIGSPVLWGGGSHGHGHIAVYAGSGYIYSTDAVRRGKVDLVRLTSITRSWGLPYFGAVGDLGGVTIDFAPVVPYAARRLPSPTGGTGLLGDDTYDIGDTGAGPAAINAYLKLGGSTFTALTREKAREAQLLLNAGGSGLRTDGRVDTPTYHAMGRAAARRSHQ